MLTDSRTTPSNRFLSVPLEKSPPARAHVHQKAQQTCRMLMPALRRSKKSDSFVPRNVYLWLSVSALLGLSASSALSHGKGPSYKQTIDFIILKLSGDSGSYKVRCDQVQECAGSVDTAWQNRVAPSSSSCSIDIVQSIHVTRPKTSSAHGPGISSAANSGATSLTNVSTISDLILAALLATALASNKLRQKARAAPWI